MSLFERIVFGKLLFNVCMVDNTIPHGVTDTIHAILPGFQKWCR